MFQLLSYGLIFQRKGSEIPAEPQPGLTGDLGPLGPIPVIPVLQGLPERPLSGCRLTKTLRSSAQRLKGNAVEMPNQTGYNRDSSGRLVTSSTGTVARTRNGMAQLADGTVKIVVGAPSQRSNGFGVDASGSLAITTSLVGATWQSGFLRAPNGALVASTTATKYETGYMRGPNGELAMSAVA